MEYITVIGTKITGHFCGPSLPAGAVAVPDFFMGTVGSDTREYDSKWNLLPLAQRVASGAFMLPPGAKIVGEEFAPMSAAELVKAGLSPRQAGQVLDTDPAGNLYLRQGTPNEQVAIGDMTQATADTINAVNIRAERDALLAGCDWIDTISAQTRIPAATLALWLTYRQALRDITKQGAFPSGAIIWPAPPDGVQS